MIAIINAAFSLITTTLIPLAFALCLLYFFWGVFKYVKTGAGSEDAAKEGKQVMVWGIVGLFVAFSVWGIISFIQTELTIPPVQMGKPGSTGSTGNSWDSLPSNCVPSGSNTCD